MVLGEYVLPTLVMVSSAHSTVRVLDAEHARGYIRAALRHLHVLTTPLVTTPTQ